MRIAAVEGEVARAANDLADDADVLSLLTTNRPDLLEPALAARTNRDEGAGGFSSNLNTRKESRSVKESRSASAISDSACGKTVPRM